MKRFDTHGMTAVVIGLALWSGCQTQPTQPKDSAMTDQPESSENISDEQWKQKLDPKEFQVLRCAATEQAFTGKYWDTKTPGVYRCAGCGQELYRSETKYDSGSGWPSFYEPITPGAVTFHEDTSGGMVRTEVRCGKCGGHLGHVFDDGPQPTFKRHCINSVSLDLDPAEE
jgi:peptide-methionine (R)-S-oxide reductase